MRGEDKNILTYNPKGKYKHFLRKHYELRWNYTDGWKGMKRKVLKYFINCMFFKKKGISFSKDLYISVATKPSKSQLYNQTITLHIFIFNCEN